MTEAILEPDLPIIDPHHHLWLRRPPKDAVPAADGHGFARVLALQPRYLFEELLADLNSGHNIRATVFLECSSMYRMDASAPMRPVGETEFANGVAAMSASGLFGETRVCAGIVGHADLSLGAAVSEVLEAHLRVSDRFRGVRNTAPYDADPSVLGPVSRTGPGLYRSPAFREGFAQLARYHLSFDAWLLEPQLPDLIDLARAFPDQPIILDHVGTPLGLGVYQGRREARFGIWRDNIRTLAALPNLTVKLGGLAMGFCNFPSFLQEPRASSDQLAAEWKPYIETCIEAFGPDRCMFESNFPVDMGVGTYAVLWNAFKLLAKGCSADEKTALFSGTAKRAYRLEV